MWVKSPEDVLVQPSLFLSKRSVKSRRTCLITQAAARIAPFPRGVSRCPIPMVRRTVAHNDWGAADIQVTPASSGTIDQPPGCWTGIRKGLTRFAPLISISLILKDEPYAVSPFATSSLPRLRLYLLKACCSSLYEQAGRTPTPYSAARAATKSRTIVTYQVA
jgi:hypothetical protein